MVFIIIISGMLIGITFYIYNHNNTTVNTNRIVEIKFDQSERILLDYSTLWVKALKVQNSDYIFFLSNLYNSTNNVLYYMKNINNGWSNPEMININLSIFNIFDCIYDEDNNIFYIFFCHEYEEQYAIFFTEWSPDSVGLIEQVTNYPQKEYPLQNIRQGAYECSATLAKNGTIYLFYSYVTGKSESLNELQFVTYNGNNWSKPIKIGAGNNPFTLIDNEGKFFIYTNMYTYSLNKQYVIDEWTLKNKLWLKNEITSSAKDCSVNPFVVIDKYGTKYLIYDHLEHKEGSKTNIILQTQRKGEPWSDNQIIIKGDINNEIRSPCITIDSDNINIYYIKNQNIFLTAGKIIS